MAEPKKKSSLIIWIVAFASVALVSLLVCAGTGYVLFSYNLLPFGRSGNSAALEKLAQELIDEHKAGGNTKAKDAVKLPESWFVEVFGAARGKDMHTRYQARSADIERRFILDIKTIQVRRFSKIEAEKYHEASAPGFFTKTLADMTGKPELLQVFFHPPADAKAGEEGIVFGPFVFVDGSYRFFSADVMWNVAK
jgi:hypothetical protein